MQSVTSCWSRLLMRVRPRYWNGCIISFGPCDVAATEPWTKGEVLAKFSPPLRYCVSCAVFSRSNGNLRKLRRRICPILSFIHVLFLLSLFLCASLARSKFLICRHDILVGRQLLRAGLLLWPAPARRNGRRSGQTRGGGLASIRNACYGAKGADPPGNVGLLHQHSGARGGSFDEHTVRPHPLCLFLSRGYRRENVAGSIHRPR